MDPLNKLTISNLETNRNRRTINWVPRLHTLTRTYIKISKRNPKHVPPYERSYFVLQIYTKRSFTSRVLPLQLMRKFGFSAKKQTVVSCYVSGSSPCILCLYNISHIMNYCTWNEILSLPKSIIELALSPSLGQLHLRSV